MTNPLDAFKAHMVKPSERNTPNFLMLYGLPGSGKTWLAGSVSEVPGIRKTLLIDTEDSTTGSLYGFDDEAIDIIPVSTHEGLESVLDAVIEASEQDDFEYDAVIIDTFDVAFERALEYYDEITPATKSGNDNTFWKWAQVGQWTNRRAGEFRDAPFLGIMVLHAKREKLDSGALMDYVSLSGKAKDVLPGIPDIVGFTVRDKGVTTVHLGSSDKRSTKNRFHLPESIENPTMKGIFDAIKNRDAVKPAPAKKKTTTKSKKEDK